MDSGAHEAGGDTGTQALPAANSLAFFLNTFQSFSFSNEILKEYMLIAENAELVKKQR